MLVCVRVCVYPLGLGQLLLQPLVAFLADFHDRGAAEARQAVAQRTALLQFLSRQEAAPLLALLAGRAAVIEKHGRQFLSRTNL